MEMEIEMEMEMEMKMEKRGIASIAILPSGSLSGHFVDAQTSQCFGLFGTQISCVRECSRGEDYKLINLSVIDYNSKKEVQIIVESHGHDAARFQNATDIHGWEEEIMEAIHGGKAKNAFVPSIKFECEILKADEDAEQHIKKYLPALADRGAVVNIGTMHIKGLKFDKVQQPEDLEHGTSTRQIYQDDINSHNEQDANAGEDDVDISRNRSAYAESSSILTSEMRSCLSCASVTKEFEDIFQKELIVEGLSSTGLSMLPDWREKTSRKVVHDSI